MQKNVVALIEHDPSVVGLAAGGSWIANELDEYSDLDLVLVTKEKISNDKKAMIAFAEKFGKLLGAFTGEHVGEPRLLICMYDDPLLHVDIKFLVPEEFRIRVEDPVVLFERGAILTSIMRNTKAEWPWPGYQWIEDRFWTWVHYIASKAGRGEYYECIDSFSFLRANVFAPLLLLKNKKTPRNVRKIEALLPYEDLALLQGVTPSYDRMDIFRSLDNAVELYLSLRDMQDEENVLRQKELEEKSIAFVKLARIKKEPDD